MKENIRDYNHGIDKLRALSVKQYDYRSPHELLKGRVGLMAEEVPPEFQGLSDKGPMVDIYGLIGLLINSVKDLSEKVEGLQSFVLGEVDRTAIIEEKACFFEDEE